MIGSKNLASIAKNRIRRRSLDVPIAGRGGYIDVGAHEVKITDVDLSRLESDGCIDFLFQNATEAKLKQRIWLLRSGVDEYSIPIVNLINAVFQDPTIYELLDQLIANPSLQEGTFYAFRGLYLNIEVMRTTGYRIDNQEGKFIIVDAVENTLLDEIRFSKLQDARDAANNKKFKRSFRRVNKYIASTDETLSKNRKMFDYAIQGLIEGAKSVENIRQIFDINTLL